MEKQYNNKTTGTRAVPTIKPTANTDRETKLSRLESQVVDLQKELVKQRSELARLKNRIGDLERQTAPRG